MRTAYIVAARRREQKAKERGEMDTKLIIYYLLEQAIRDKIVR